MSLGRHWRARGKVAQPHALLVDIYGWFSEGLETADLVAARLLIEDPGSECLTADETLTSC